MKKTLSKRVLSGVTSAMIGFSSFAQAMTAENAGLLNVKAAGISTNDLLNSMKAADESFAPYSKEYSVENLLTDYNVVTFGDMYMNTHTVGAILVGGTLTASDHVPGGSTFGDGAMENSYAQKIHRVGGYSYGKYLENEYAGDKSDYKFYYGSLDEEFDKEPDVIPTVQTDTPYFNAETATTKVTNWSNSKRDDKTAWIVGEDDLSGDNSNVLEITVTDETNKNIVLPEEIHTKLNKIVFVGKDGGVVKPEEIANAGFTITFKGQPKDNRDGALHLGFQGFVQYRTTNTEGKLTDVQLTKTFTGLSGNAQNGELNLYGMNLIWNFPDAEGDLFVNSTSGHIVAPKARVVIQGGEGGVIANEAVIVSEIHFYSYKTNTTSDKAPGNNEDTTKPSTPPAEDVEKITIEARVIYGDYNDDDAHKYNNPELYAPQLQLMYRQGDEIGKKPEIDDYKVTAELVEDGTEARKDWCYQYKYTWEVPVLPDGDRTGYYVSLNPNNAGVSEFDRNDYNFYFLPEVLPIHTTNYNFFSILNAEYNFNFLAVMRDINNINHFSSNIVLVLNGKFIPIFEWF